MRMKEEILEELKHLPTGSVHQTQNVTKTTKALVEVMLDIRDILHKDMAQLIEDLNSIANKD